jgi:hypothetical protein
VVRRRDPSRDLRARADPHPRRAAHHLGQRAARDAEAPHAGREAPHLARLRSGPDPTQGNRATINQGQVYRSGGRVTSFAPTFRMGHRPRRQEAAHLSRGWTVRPPLLPVVHVGPRRLGDRTLQDADAGSGPAGHDARPDGRRAAGRAIARARGHPAGGTCDGSSAATTSAPSAPGRTCSSAGVSCTWRTAAPSPPRTRSSSPTSRSCTSSGRSRAWSTSSIASASTIRSSSSACRGSTASSSAPRSSSRSRR